MTPGGGTAGRSTRAVIFDFYGTLAEAVEWGPSFQDVLASHGLRAPEGDSWSSFDYDGHEHLQHSQSRDHYVAWERARLRNLAVAAGAADGMADALADEIHRATKAFRLRVYDDVFGVLEGLRGSGIRLAVCSNWDWDLPDVLDGLGLASAFDVVVTSARVGARKPHPRIYASTLERLAVGAADALFVGDSLGPDIEGPSAEGMRAVLVQRTLDDDSGGGTADDNSAGPQVATLPNLEGLRDLL